ncbi:MAG: tyrosine-protein kinase domain-containing protein [Thermoleophilia bacterium]
MENMTVTHGGSDIRGYLEVLWRRKLIIILAVFLITTVAVASTIIFETPLYYSSTDMMQRDTGLDRVLLGSDLFIESSYQPERTMSTAAELVLAPEVVSRVASELREELDGQDPSAMVSVSLVKQTDIFRVTAVNADPELAALVANAFAAEYIEWRREVDQEALREARAPIEAQVQSTPEEQKQTADYQVLTQTLASLKLTESILTNDIEVVKPATVPGAPSSPRPVRTGVIAFFVSFIFGIGTVLTVDRFDTKIRNSDEITRRIQSPILASVPWSADGSMTTLTNPGSPASEAYRLLKTNLNYVMPGQDLKSIMITSPEPCEGKSTTISNLAITLARAGKRVIILEADLRRPMLAKYFGLDNSVGLSNAIVDSCTLMESLQLIEASSISIPDLADSANKASTGGASTKPIYVATAGPLPPNPGELVASDKLAALIAEANKHADYVLVDAPPLTAVGDAASLASKVDGVVLVVRMAQTSKRSLDFVKSRFIDSVPCNFLGLVVTNATNNSTYGSYYNGGYYTS